MWYLRVGRHDQGSCSVSSSVRPWSVVYSAGICSSCVSQGPYSAEGDIVVLCAYLGQLSRLRDALANEVAVVLDERDKAELDDQNAEAEDITQLSSSFERVKVTRRVSASSKHQSDS